MGPTGKRHPRPSLRAGVTEQRAPPGNFGPMTADGCAGLAIIVDPLGRPHPSTRPQKSSVHHLEPRALSPRTAGRRESAHCCSARVVSAFGQLHKAGELNHGSWDLVVAALGSGRHWCQLNCSLETPHHRGSTHLYGQGTTPCDSRRRIGGPGGGLQ
ncbi:uncharacterized protein [Zea mays]|uniref:uncharacterized protein n=1 Tax=Zea mays TaxID=4577 RepID=UPI0004DEBDB3|nr:uncharacterized protein LOC103640820 [Zea mays]|eukprot:XP_008662513.1 uncharacterized protein LOC103640820 [Zea mays]